MSGSQTKAPGSAGGYLRDHTIGLISFKLICDQQAGAKIYHVVDGVEGVLWGSGQRAKPYSTYGYTFYETQGKGSEVFRYAQSEGGGVTEEIDNGPKARFLVRRNENVQIGAHLKRSDFEVVELSTGRTLAVHSIVHFGGGWLIRALRGIGLGGSVCPAEPFNSVEFIHAVLKPKENVE